jgi:hypothetical protein
MQELGALRRDGEDAHPAVVRVAAARHQAGVDEAPRERRDATGGKPQPMRESARCEASEPLWSAAAT